MPEFRHRTREGDNTSPWSDDPKSGGLDFEAPIAELERKIEELESFAETTEWTSAARSNSSARAAASSRRKSSRT